MGFSNSVSFSFFANPIRIHALGPVEFTDADLIALKELLLRHSGRRCPGFVIFLLSLFRPRIGVVRLLPQNDAWRGEETPEARE